MWVCTFILFGKMKSGITELCGGCLFTFKEIAKLPSKVVVSKKKNTGQNTLSNGF